MTLSWIDSVFSLHELRHIISTYGYWAVAVVICFECLGLPLPGESILIAAAIYAARSHALNIWLVIGAAALGAVLGNAIGYWIGRQGGYRLLLRYGPRLNITHRRIKLGQYLFLTHGGKIVFFGRFFAVVRVFAALLAGANRMNWRPFLSFSIAGGVVWAAFFGAGGYYLGGKLHLIIRYVGIGSGLAAVILVTAAVIFLRRQEARLQSEAERALPGPLKAP
ncbi:MAG TPA: DedA family protein [Pseudolabrys sp.]|jgi:membrane protein DedA with SNARE-associated domain